MVHRWSLFPHPQASKAKGNLLPSSLEAFLSPRETHPHMVSETQSPPCKSPFLVSQRYQRLLFHGIWGLGKLFPFWHLLLSQSVVVFSTPTIKWRKKAKLRLNERHKYSPGRQELVCGGIPQGKRHQSWETKSCFQRKRVSHYRNATLPYPKKLLFPVSWGNQKLKLFVFSSILSFTKAACTSICWSPHSLVPDYSASFAFPITWLSIKKILPTCR